MAYKKHALLGQRFGMLSVVGEAPAGMFPGHRPWECLCDCGGVCYVASTDLIRVHKTSCGKHNKGGINSFIDLTGKYIGFFRVVCRASDAITKGRQKKTRWRCICICGNSVLVRADPLINGRIKSCGCKKVSLICSARGFNQRPKKVKVTTYRQVNVAGSNIQNPLESWEWCQAISPFSHGNGRAGVSHRSA